MKSVHILIFKGVGLWKDQDGVVYKQNDRVEMKSDKDEKGFLESRPDIKFMVGYGQLEINTATTETETPPVDQKVVTPGAVVPGAVVPGQKAVATGAVATGTATK
jgi:hypothetical protein